MNRKNFIRNMSIIGVSVSLSPWKLVGAESSIQRFRLPPASVHIPHGNFATNKTEQLLIPELNLSVTCQVFMKHGICSSTDDLKITTIQRGKQILNVSLSNNVLESAGNIEGVELILEKQQIVLLENKNRLLLNTMDETAQLIK